MRTSLRALLALALVAAGSTAQTTTLPVGAAGSQAASQPWWGVNSSTPAVRTQDCYDGAQLAAIGQPILITGLRWRAGPRALGDSWSGGTFTHCTIRVGAAGVDHAAMHQVFADNWPGGVVPEPAYSGPVAVAPGAGVGTGAPGPWCITVVITPTWFDPTSGDDLLIEIEHDATFVGSGAVPASPASAVHPGTTAHSVRSSYYGSLVVGGVADNRCQVVELTYVAAPVVTASFTLERGTAGPGETIRATSTSRTSDQGGITSHAWDFDGDAVTDATTGAATFAYSSCGTHQVTLTVAAASGTAQERRTITIGVPVASFTAMHDGGRAPIEVQFTDTSTNAPTSWAWDFDGDGNVDATQQHPRWVFPRAGRATVALATANACGGAQASMAVDTTGKPTIRSSWASDNGSGPIAYDPITDEVWTITAVNSIVERRTRAGALLDRLSLRPVIGSLAAIPIAGAVDPLSGDLWIMDRTGAFVYAVSRTTGARVRSFSPSLPATDLAIDPGSHDLFLAFGAPPRVQEFAPTGSPVGAPVGLANVFAAAGLRFVEIGGIAYDARTDDFIVGAFATSGPVLVVTTRFGQLLRVVPLGAVFDQATGQTLRIMPASVDLDPATGSVFVGDGAAARVFELIDVLARTPRTSGSEGVGCADSGGSAPWLGFSNPIRPGARFDVAVQTTCVPSSSAAAYFLIGTHAIDVDLGIAGFPGCPLLVAPDLGVIGPVPLNANRRAGVSLIGPGLFGASLVWQAVIAPDIGTSALVTSNRVKVGIR